MAEDEKQTNENNDTGKETDTNSEEDKTENNNSPLPLEEAKEINKKKEELLEREEKLQIRKEQLHAEQMVGGNASAGQTTEEPKKLTDTEYAEALERGEVNPLKEDGLI